MNQTNEAGKIIFLNGASSSGKSTIVRALRDVLPDPFLYFSFDHFHEADILPMDRIRSQEFDWASMRESVFEAFHHSVAAMPEAGCNLLVEHIIETEEWRARLEQLFQNSDIFTINVLCPLDDLEQRERVRGDRPIGDARKDFETCYDFCEVDFEIDSRQDPKDNAIRIIEAWQARDQSNLTRFKSRGNTTKAD